MKVLSFIPCEDVRTEVGGKSTLVGVVEGIAFHESRLKNGPAILRAAAYLRIELEKNEPTPNEVSVVVAFNGKEVISAGTPFLFSKPDRPASLSVPVTLIPVDGSGDITFTYVFKKHGEHEWPPLVFRLPVETIPDQASSI
jgi:hypothetical protein